MARAHATNRDSHAPPRRLPLTLLFAGLVLAMSAAGTGAARGAPAAGPSPAFGPGEVLVYDVHYGPVHTGQARIAVGADQTVSNTRVWPIVVQARTNDVFSHFYSVRDRFVTLWNPADASTIGFDLFADENGRRRHERARLDPKNGHAVVERQRPGHKPSTHKYKTGTAAHDVASAIFWLRTQKLAVGDTDTIRVFTGEKAWELGAHVEGRETIRTQAGRFHTLRVRLRTHFRGKLAARHDIVLWMTDDAAHVPVRIAAELVLGSVQADLQRYLPGIAP